MNMTPERWDFTSDYICEVFGREDDHLRALMPRAVEAGLPDIAVDASVGRLLSLLAKMVDARLVIELGTLAGYSGIWLARGLSEGGRLVTVEPEVTHADFAQQSFIDAGVADRVEIMRTTGLPALESLLAQHGEGAADLIFMDAIKTEYPDYLPLAKRLLRQGGLLVFDNMLGGGWWIDDAPGSSPSRDAADRVNHLVSDDPDLDAACLPIREGVLVARKR
ncbi:MAG: O-methyltransferase [Planctomycetota bacterium]